MVPPYWFIFRLETEHEFATSSDSKKRVRIHSSTHYRIRWGFIFASTLESGFKNIRISCRRFAGCAWREAVSGMKKLRIEKYPDMCGRNLNTSMTTATRTSTDKRFTEQSKAVHVRFWSLYISLPSSAKPLAFLGRRRTRWRRLIFIFPFGIERCFCISLAWARFQSHWHISQILSPLQKFQHTL